MKKILLQIYEWLRRRARALYVFFLQRPTMLFFSIALLVAGLSHGINMLNYPYYESDEGTYTSQAWSLVREGTLAPYTYWYDHPPFGWMVIAGWAKMLPNDFFTFGTSIDTGRVLMLIVHLIATALIFYIVKRITQSNWIALFTCLFYVLSPIGIYFRRRVLLDNLMNLWLLASIAVLYRPVLKLRHFALSGLLFAASFLTKISAIFFGPALLYLIAAKRYAIHYSFRIITWFSVAALTISIYPIYSMLKGEFFPAENGDHVSLIGSFFYQMSRGNNVPFYKQGSDFMGIVNDLAMRDLPYMIVLGLVIIAGIWAATRNLHARFFLIAIAVYFLFLIRGGVVLNFYVLPLLTFISLLAGVIVHEISLVIAKYRSTIPKLGFGTRIAIPAFLVLILALYYSFGATTKHLTANETANQRKSIAWIKDNLPEDADIIIDNIMYVELHDPNYYNSKVFKNAEWFYKVSRDPMISDTKYNRNWRQFDYIALTHEMLKSLDRFDENDISLLAFKNSLPMVKWIEGTTAFIDEQKFITTNGDWAMVYAINGNTKTQLVDSWKRYKATNIYSYGQVIDETTGFTTSEGQAYAMLQAVWMNDKETFDGVWAWTQHHLQYRIGDSFISWKWQDDKLIDPVNATDADQDIALALLFASRTWEDDRYKEEALKIIHDLWNYAIVESDGVYYVLAMNKNDARREGYLFNPSYLSPAAYRIFAKADTDHDWNKVASDSYTILQRISNNSTLPANWYELKLDTGILDAADTYIGPNASQYGYDAFRIFWRVGLDATWFNNYSAKEYLKKYADFFQRELETYGRLPSVYTASSGEPVLWEDSPSVQIGALIALQNSNYRSSAIRLYDQIIGNTYNDNEKLWENAQIYYEYNWVWFGSALFNNNIRNLWDTP